MERRIYRWEENFYLNYHNEKELGFCDFIEEIKKDLLKIISKIRGFIVENSGILFGIIYNDYYGNGWVINYKTEEEFCVNGVCSEKFAKYSLNCANECFKANVDENEWLKFKFRKDFLNLKNGVSNDDDSAFEEYLNKIYYEGVSGYYDKECDINKFDNNFIIDFIDIMIEINPHKLEHKNKFYKDLHYDLMKAIHKRKFYKDLRDELIIITWHPSRYLDWCIDFEEQKFLKEEVFGEED